MKPNYSYDNLIVRFDCSHKIIAVHGIKYEFLKLIFLFSNDNKNDAIQIKTNFYDVQLDFQRDEAFDVMFFHWPTVVCTGSKMHVFVMFFSCHPALNISLN